MDHQTLSNLSLTFSTPVGHQMLPTNLTPSRTRYDTPAVTTHVKLIVRQRSGAGMKGKGVPAETKPTLTPGGGTGGGGARLNLYPTRPA